jgi:hypothetical protein
MSSELHRLWEQRDVVDALVEALRTGDEWLAYQAEVLRDQLLELEAQTTEGASAVEKVRIALGTGTRRYRGRGKIWRERAPGGGVGD